MHDGHREDPANTHKQKGCLIVFDCQIETQSCSAERRNSSCIGTQAHQRIFGCSKSSRPERPPEKINQGSDCRINDIHVKDPKT